MSKPVNGGPTKPTTTRTTKTDDKISTFKNYKNFTKLPEESYDNNNNNSNRIKSKHKCLCSTCLTVGRDLLQRKYIDFDNILIEDESKLIFSPLFERCVN